MQNSIDIETQIIEDINGNDLINIIIPQDILRSYPARDFIQNKLLEAYLNFVKDKKESAASCIVTINSEKTDSRVDRALFILYKEVREERKGQLVIIGYPEQSIESLTTLGLTFLEGFELADSEEAARKIINKTS